MANNEGELMEKPENIFVLTTGRSGSDSFAHACCHMTNFSSAHESLSGSIGEERFAYPKGHIEVDNRLAWHLGGLHRRFPNAWYVYLKRTPEAVAKSYNLRWQEPRSLLGAIRHQSRLFHPWRSLPAVFGNGILLKYSRWEDDEKIKVSEFLVETINDNIENFISNKPSIEVNIENIDEDFSLFWSWIGAKGDLSQALSEFHRRHNSTKSNRLRQW